jgi:polysaccharide biosynthesis/export protein
MIDCINFKKTTYLLLLILVFASGCATYRQNIMFRTQDGDNVALKSEIEVIEKNYRIKENDLLDIQIYTNNGERLIDPNQEFEIGSGRPQGSGSNNAELLRPRYLVQKGGEVRLPMVGMIKLADFTLNQADSILQIAYSEYYKDAFVYTKYLNKRVFILGSIGGQQGAGQIGGGGRVVPLENEDMNLIELLATVGGVSGQAKANNIRLIRGDLKNPYVEIIDLSTIQGMKKATLKLEPNDIVYIEPIRRPFLEAFRDYSSVISFLTGFASLTLSTVILIQSLNNN